MKCLLLPFLVVIAINANGAVIVDSLAAKNTNENVYRRAGQAFHTTYGYWIVTDVRLIGIGSSSNIKISIFSSDSTKPVSNLATLYTGTAAGAGFSTQTTNKNPTSFTFDPVILAPSTQYWIVVEDFSNSDLSLGATFSNAIYGDGYSYAARNSTSEITWGSYNSNPYALRVTAIPEPGHFMMFCFGALMMLRRSRTPERTSRVS